MSYYAYFGFGAISFFLVTIIMTISTMFDFCFLLIVIAFGRASVLDLVIDASRASTAETIVFPERTSPTVAANMRFLRGGLVTFSKAPICSVLPETAVSVVASPH